MHEFEYTQEYNGKQKQYNDVFTTMGTKIESIDCEIVNLLSLSVYRRALGEQRGVVSQKQQVKEERGVVSHRKWSILQDRFKCFCQSKCTKRFL